MSSNKKIFRESITMYIEVLKNSRFKEEFSYLELKVSDNIDNYNNKLDMNKENTNCNNKVNSRKNRKGKLYGSTPLFENLLI